MVSESLGNYRLLRLLATGGMGEVFLAEQEGPHSFRRRVVVKRLLRHLASDPTFVEMFLDEARLAALITHPNVVPIIELGESAGTFFIAMEYVRGQSLREIANALHEHGERTPPKVAVAILVGVLRGLHAAHTLVDTEGNLRGCVHRDVSADNVLLSVEGAVKLVDFGIAKALGASTARGTALRGKFGYMAPEQYHRKRIDARTDVWASGVLLFELLAGARPFVADHEAGIMHGILNEPPPSLRGRFDCPARLETIVERALAKEPRERFESAEAMADELEALLASGELGSGEASAELRDFARRWIGEEPESLEARGVTESVAGLPREQPTQTAPMVTEIVSGPRARLQAATGGRRRRMAFASVALVGVALAVVAAAATTPRAFSRAAPRSSGEQQASPVGSGTGAPSAATTNIATTSSSDRERVAGAPAPSTSAKVVVLRSSSVGESTKAPLEPKPPRRAPAAPDSSAGRGTLALRVRPWAEIFVDGRSVGISPVSPVDLPAGRHHVLLRNKDLGKERAFFTQVTRGETTTLRVDLLE